MNRHIYNHCFLFERFLLKCFHVSVGMLLCPPQRVPTSRFSAKSSSDMSCGLTDLYNDLSPF